ncbi:MAG: hypothetical protein UT34_C0001G0290 [candidate division WS6 bacterium GW2011_GWF2_39_15]|uniref:HTH cro/C1-type domain-containing protein n=1 Tax=candidate division WS6 bacterium GW2011_GWF2_39_15 TaxID=1619100 RepID=A0A0G0Q750_9BACT|nr:MAG: hypothetical protein UT34_C0001G0290 [candidate division WS6 bacterium GW2011_GWF2_39_15]
MKNKSFDVKFGKIVKEMRLKSGLTQEKLAFKADVSSNYIGRIERGMVSPSITVVYSVAKAMGITLKELLKEI